MKRGFNTVERWTITSNNNINIEREREKALKVLCETEPCVLTIAIRIDYLDGMGALTVHSECVCVCV